MNALAARAVLPQPQQPASTATPAALAAERIDVVSGDIAVLRDISFTLRRGEVLGLIGESGAGKSMIGRLIARQLPPGFRVTGGSLALDGRNLLAMPETAHRGLLGDRIAFIPQEPMSALNPSRTIGAHFAEHLARLGVPAREARGRTLETLADMRLPAPQDVIEKFPFQLSGGMCQRVLIALAFISNPDIVIADEPTASLDVTTQVHIIGLLRRLQDRYGTSVLFITHHLRLAAHICDHVAVLYAGEVVEHGAVSDVFGRPRHPYTIGLDEANPRFDAGREPLASMVGQMPALTEFGRLNGCRFVPRCAAATAACAASVPALRTVDRRDIRCIFDGARPLTDTPPPLGAVTPAVADAAPILELRSVSKTFRRGGIFSRRSSTDAVKSVSLAIKPGEFIGIVGESGSGKSTLGRMIMGLEQPSSGDILLEGAPLGGGAGEWRRRIASIQLVFQDPRSALNPRRRVFSLVTQPLEATSLPATERSARAEALMRDIGLSADMLGRYPLQMSGGQRQRINIARALCARPRLLIADEIVSGLDVSVQAQILNLLHQLRAEYNIALVMISHDLAVVRHLCDRVFVMCRGDVVESGPTEDVFAAPRHAYTRELLAAVPSEDLSQPWPNRTDRGG